MREKRGTGQRRGEKRKREERGGTHEKTERRRKEVHATQQNTVYAVTE